MYLCAGELLPAVFHVSDCVLARQSLSIFCDHRALQEVVDLGLVSHLASLKSSLPFVDFFDGTRTSGAIEKMRPIPCSAMKSLVPWG